MQGIPVHRSASRPRLRRPALELEAQHAHIDPGHEALRPSPFPDLIT
ncbi:MAG: hypothetical protein R2856_29615 [Caldilineaceae bacterium]